MTTAQRIIHLDVSMRARRVAYSLLSGASGLYQKTKLLWGEVQRIRRRIRRGFERIRSLFGGFAYETHAYCVGF